MNEDINKSVADLRGFLTVNLRRIISRPVITAQIICSCFQVLQGVRVFKRKLSYSGSTQRLQMRPQPASCPMS